MDGKSKDLMQDKIEQLQKLFTEVFSENRIDFIKLKKALGEDNHAQGEHYELSWAGKSEARKEVQDETSVDFTGRIKNARDKAKIKLNKELNIENFPFLYEIWDKISRQTGYSVELSTEDLITNTVSDLKDYSIYPKTKGPILESKTANLEMTAEGIESKLKDTYIMRTENIKYQIPDVYGYIQNKVDNTRKIIYEILIQSDRYEELEINPQLFLDNVVSCIQPNLNKLLVDGVKYKEIAGKKYEMSLFKSEEIETYLENLFEVSNKDKTVFNYVPIDSSIESNFAQDCEADPNIKFFFKLTRNFKVPTQIGNYIPDLAVVFEEDKRIYFVAETKSNLDQQLLRDIERMKIECGKKHFALFKSLKVEYKQVVEVKDLYE